MKATRAQQEQPIGVFDSGIGGLTVVRALSARLPHENIVYFGDTARVPYGPKSPQVVREYAAQTSVTVRYLQSDPRDKSKALNLGIRESETEW